MVVLARCPKQFEIVPTPGGAEDRRAAFCDPAQRLARADALTDASGARNHLPVPGFAHTARVDGHQLWSFSAFGNLGPSAGAVIA